MSAARNNAVIECWYDHDSAHNHRGSLRTDGKGLWSYELQIGDTTDDGRKVLKDYRAGQSHGWRSQTTSCHVGLAARVADVIV